MTQKQPEALRLAEMLCYMADNGDMGRKPDPKCNKRQAATELRRLHEVNAELLEALKASVELVEREVAQADSLFLPAKQHQNLAGTPIRSFESKCYEITAWRAAIAKAKGKVK